MQFPRITILSPDDPRVLENLRLYERYVETEGAQHFGQGEFEIYAFTFPALCRAAELEGQSIYPIKIGYTSVENDAVWRIVQHMFKADPFPERAQLLLSWRASEGRQLEHRIHAELKAMGRRIVGAPGSEWFSTNVSELIAVFERVTESSAAKLRRRRDYKFYVGPDGMRRASP